ncbi:MAG: hypothetical protein EON96_06985 [Caulobacteraceae bacterium]|nr:MAG: hypothetical protein EON96_06985 [Caulobacteraceae bacterium]
MIRKAALAAMAMLALTVPAAAQAPVFDGRALADQAIATARREAYRSGKVDWPALEAKVHAAAGQARDELDMLAVYAQLLEGLGDGHSFVQVPDDRRKAYLARHGREFDATAAHYPQTSAFIMRRDQAFQRLKLGPRAEATILVAPKVFGGGAGAKAYANGLYRALADAAPTSCGYVLDLRGNVGGNLWPMLTGLSPLLGDGFASGEEDASGARSVYANLKSGAAVIAAGPRPAPSARRPMGWPAPTPASSNPMAPTW